MKVELLLFERREERICLEMGRRGSEGEDIYIVLCRISRRGPDVVRRDWATRSTALTVPNGLEADVVVQR